MRFLGRFALTGPPWLGAVLLTVLCAAQSASAVTVTYTTSGVWASSGTSTSLQGLVYAQPVPALVSLDTPSFESLGLLSSSAAPSNLSDMLTITISQVLPGPGNDTVVGTVSGFISFSSSLGQLVFTTTSVATITGGGWAVTYNPQDATSINPPGGTPVSIQALITATAVPLPAAAWGGIALFGVIGGAKLRRSRQFVA